MIPQFSANCATWWCPACHAENSGGVIDCACGEGRRPREASLDTASLRWWCSSCHHLNLSREILCECGRSRWDKLGIEGPIARTLAEKIIAGGAR